jgi:hypothetical protein
MTKFMSLLANVLTPTEKTAVNVMESPIFAEIAGNKTLKSVLLTAGKGHSIICNKHNDARPCDLHGGSVWDTINQSETKFAQVNLRKRRWRRGNYCASRCTHGRAVNAGTRSSYLSLYQSAALRPDHLPPPK